MRKLKFTEGLPAAHNLQELTAELLLLDDKIKVSYNPEITLHKKNGKTEIVPRAFNVECKDETTAGSISSVISNHIPTETEKQTGQRQTLVELSAKIEPTAIIQDIITRLVALEKGKT